MKYKRSVTFEGWTTPPDFESDGCTLAPDRWWTFRRGWVDLTDACILHDFLRNYALVPMREADSRFRRHLISVGAPRYMAWVYWFAVKKTKSIFTKTYMLPIRWDKYSKPTDNNK